MKIIHCSDLHLDSKMESNLTREQAKERKRELLLTFERMVSYAAEQGVQVIIIAGDLFDTTHIGKTVAKLVAEQITSHPDIDFLYLQGNHEKNRFLESLESIPENLKSFEDTWTKYSYELTEALSELMTEQDITTYNVPAEHTPSSESGATIENDASTEDETTIENDTATEDETTTENETASDNSIVSGMSRVTISGVELTPENSKGIYDSLVLAQDEINLVVLHGQESQYDARDKAEIINIRALQNKYIDYLALGHLHEYKFQKLDNRGSYCYSGCLEGRGFDECGEKGFVLLEIADGTVTHRFIPFAGRRLYEIPVDISDCHTTGEIVGQINTAIEGIDKDSLVKLVLVGEVEMDTDKDIVYLLKKYETQFYFVKIYDKTKLAVNYEDYRLDQSLKGEFIRLLEKADLPQEEKDAVILTGIRALSGEEI